MNLKSTLIDILIINIFLSPIYISIWFSNIYIRLHGMVWTLGFSVLGFFLFRNKVKLKLEVKENGK